MEKAFHGRTMATLTASGSRKVQAGFEPLVLGLFVLPSMILMPFILLRPTERMWLQLW